MANNNPETSAQLVPQINKEKSTLSKLQRQFNSKINKINKLKSSLQERQELVNQIQTRAQQELQPVLSQITDHKVEMVRLLDKAYDLKYFRKNEQKKLAYLIEEMAYNLIQYKGKEELIEIHDKYAPMSYAEVVEEADAEANQIAQDLFKSFFADDIDLEEEDLSDIEKMKSKLESKMQEEEQARSQRHKAPRKKTKAQLAKEEAMKEEMNNISKASRRIYTDLVKLLHPDKEQDETKRTWKEEAIKEVTKAYNNDDFFELLRLQMEYLQDKSKAIEEMPEDQLKYYVKLLNEQLKELELESAEFNFSPESRLLYEFGSKPKSIDLKFRREKQSLQRTLDQLLRDLEGFKDPENIRTFLKFMKIS